MPVILGMPADFNYGAEKPMLAERGVRAHRAKKKAKRLELRDESITHTVCFMFEPKRTASYDAKLKLALSTAWLCAKDLLPDGLTSAPAVAACFEKLGEKSR